MNGRLNSPEASPAAYREAARGLAADPPPGLRPVRLAMLSTFTVSPLEPYVVVEGARLGLHVTPWFGPYDQLEPQALDPASPLYAARADVVVIAARLEDLAPDLFWSLAGLGPDAVDAQLTAIIERYETLVTAIKRHGAATVLLANFTEPVASPLGLAGALHEPSPAAVVAGANAALAALCRRTSGVYVLDLARAALEIGLERWNDPKLAYLARIPWSLAAQIEVGKTLARHLNALYVPARKCLVVDLDGTLWGGVLGEDGPEGIALGTDYPGRAYQDFQRALAGLRARGILLAIASKNDEPTVREVFDEHPDMVLRWDDFAAAEVHWNDKASSLRAIAAALNIGVDALAFYDDSAIEREWVRVQLPEVAVLDVPDSPLERGRALDDSGVFDQLRLSEDDRRRADAYREEGERDRLRAQAVTPEDFWRSLGTTVRVGPVDADNLPRMVQLMAKTNQFTVTTRRHTAAQIEAMLAAGAVGLWLRAWDRYGDYGLVGVALAVPDGAGAVPDGAGAVPDGGLAVPDGAGAWRIDSFLLSCRALGRHVEGAMLAALARVVARRGGRWLIGEFTATGRNQPAERFFAEHGFAPLDTDGRWWRRELDAAALEPPPFVALEPSDDSTASRGHAAAAGNDDPDATGRGNLGSAERHDEKVGRGGR